MTFLTLSTDNALNHNNGLDILRILIKLVNNLTYTLKIISPSEQIKEAGFPVCMCDTSHYTKKLFYQDFY